MLKRFFIILIGLFIIAGTAFSASAPVRIKDIGHVLEARENQLMGFGLVVGLKNSGDSQQTGFTQQALTNLLSRMGVVPQSVDFKSRNAAAVMVTATLPPFMKPGQKLDINVSSMGDARSLQGGTLLITPLVGVDDEIYAVAQGRLVIGGLGDTQTISPLRGENTNVGHIPGGALVEKEVEVSLAGKQSITIVLDKPDFTTAVRVADSILENGMEAVAKDAATISVPYFEGEDPVKIIARVENFKVVPATVAKVVINEKTGTIVIGEDVRIAPVAVTYGNMTVTVGSLSLYTQSNAFGSEDESYTTSTQTKARVSRPSGDFKQLGQTASLSELVAALNSIGASPKDLVVILQAIKRAGALSAEIEVI
ncbi:MAG: flagellar basal body P-ring protein FlgI [Candidatus Margulisbacteria bacterium]|nr:flagellar basal body P-ring protein FlgI [Candidatus Margulisiibacteriota bacterium]MBU1021485.1 flagellar basal body P-ring protein FlgI [Candidatus Margulisiibacteriota bacterium]MBU1728570.1 flagellar basal body P-ring protein FlgI [Candidatus Margulisiibacteriota bacterium]MBU1955851.1 flagellar basal body P-ring protein FlgI [Candidatus Margulisiibacteriota bacterium]